MLVRTCYCATAPNRRAAGGGGAAAAAATALLASWVQVGKFPVADRPRAGILLSAVHASGAYDITPDWNPVLGFVPGIGGLMVNFGFSGHGFKLAPSIGKVQAQTALGLATDVDISGYGLDRFETGRLLTGAYGIGSIS